MRESTTNLNKVKDGTPFTWGEITKFYEIGPYTIAAYHPRKIKGVTLSHETDYDEVAYHGWIDGKSCGSHWDSLDAAMAGCIACRHEGCNHYADGYFMRMLRED